MDIFSGLPSKTYNGMHYRELLLKMGTSSSYLMKISPWESSCLVAVEVSHWVTPIMRPGHRSFSSISLRMEMASGKCNGMLYIYILYDLISGPLQLNVVSSPNYLKSIFISAWIHAFLCMQTEFLSSALRSNDFFLFISFWLKPSVIRWGVWHWPPTCLLK